MAGLIDVGILKPELAGSFAAGYRGAEQARQQAAQAEQQLARGRQQMQMDDMTMKRLQEDRAAMLQLQERLKAAGQDPDLDKVFDALISTGNPDLVVKGTEGKQRLREQKEFARVQGFDLPSAAPVAAAPTGAAPTAAAPAGRAAPELIAQTQGRINNLMRFAATASPQMANNALAQARILQDQLELYSKPGPAPAAPARLQDRFVPVGKLVFDRQEQQFITPPAAAVAATPGRAAAAPAPKEPAAKPPTAAQAAKSERMAEARQALSRDIETQLGYYERLASMGGMVSPSRSPVANVAAFARSSGLGQKAEQALGTEAQTLRDNIKNTRQRLFMQIKDATGATSGQMNSNMEMQAWLDSMTNPQQSIETVRETLKQMDSVIAGVQAQVERERAGKGAPERPAAAPAAAPAPTAPAKRREIAPGVFVTERP